MLSAHFDYATVEDWGNHRVLNASGSVNTDASFIGNLNPFRYRGYYFDTNTGFSTLSEFYDTFLSLNQSWSFGKAFSIAATEFWVTKRSKFITGLALLPVVGETIETLDAIFGSPDTSNGKWILY